MFKILYKTLKRFLSPDKRKQLEIISLLGYGYRCKTEEVKPLIIYSLDGKLFTNGLVDRLRGVVNSYAYAKANNLEFRIEHKSPFPLEEFLTPNTCDWILQPFEKSYNLRYASPVCMLDNPNETGESLLKLSKERQYHFYTNSGNLISFINKTKGTSYTIASLYNELFTPSQKLKDEIDKQKEILGDNYISISFRFMQLMGDLVDIHGETLSDAEQKKLTEACITQIERVKEQHPSVDKILVTSDSQKFIDSVSNIPYVYVIPGEIGHIGHMGGDIFMKTFLDFYMIAGAKKVYLGVGNKMYRSNFSHFAAQIQGKPFELIKFKL